MIRIAARGSLLVQVLLMFLLCATAVTCQAECTPYLGQTPPDDTKHLFAYGFIPTSYYAHGALHFSSDGCEAYWSMYGDPSTFVIMESLYDGSTWTTPAPVQFTSPAGDCSPFLTIDDNRLIFTSLRPKPPGIESPISFWSVDRDADRWSDPALLGEPFASATVAWQGSITDSGDIYFPQMQNAAGDKSAEEDWDIVRSRLVDGVYQPIEHLGYDVNSISWEFSPYVSPDGGYVIFRSDRPGGYGRGDLWISFSSDDGSWTVAENLGSAVNSSGDDGYPSVSHDGNYLFWVGPSPTGYAYYWISISVVEDLRPDPVSVVEDGLGGGVQPRRFELAQNYPNPFNPSTKISFELTQRTIVSLRVYDLTGHVVRTLASGESVGPGLHERIWRGRDEGGRTVAAGVYLVRLEGEGHSETKRMVLLK